MKQVLIAFDQLINTLLGGFADETLSARAYRLSGDSRRWHIAMRMIDALFSGRRHIAMRLMRARENVGIYRPPIVR